MGTSLQGIAHREVFRSHFHSFLPVCYQELMLLEKGLVQHVFQVYFTTEPALSSNQTDECFLILTGAAVLTNPTTNLNSLESVLGSIFQSCKHTLCRTVGSKLREFILLPKFVYRIKNINRFRSSSEQICEGHIYHSLPRRLAMMQPNVQANVT